MIKNRKIVAHQGIHGYEFLSVFGLRKIKNVWNKYRHLNMYTGSTRFDKEQVIILISQLTSFKKKMLDFLKKKKKTTD